MQDFTSAICKSITGTNPTGQLVDSRDEKTYWITKLKDGNCWMTQNLDYDGGGMRYGSPWSFQDNNIRAYYDPGYVDYNGNTVTDTHQLVGNYYTWMAATNGTGASATSNGANASGSICPTNWKLPTSNNTNSGSFGGLTNGISAGSTLVTSPYYFQYGGNVGSGKLNSAGGYGYYWSSTASNSTQAYYLYFDSSSVDPSNYGARYFGFSVRCLVETNSTGGAIWT